MLVVCLFFAAVSGTIARTLFKRRMNEIEGTDSLRSKFDTYSKASIVASAVIEGTIFFSLACYFLTYNPSIKKAGTNINESPENLKQQLQA